MKRSITILLSIFFLAGSAFAAPVPNYAITAATYDWINIEDAANNTGINCDDCGVNKSIGFNFNHYGNIYSSVNISSNGYLTFGGTISDYTNDDIPSATDPDDHIALFWDDIYVTAGAGSKIYSATIGTAPNRKFVVTYHDVDFCCTQNNGEMSFQVILSEVDGSITFHYKDMKSIDAARGSGNSATIGIENSNGSGGLKHSYNTISAIDDQTGFRIVDSTDTDADGLPDYWETAYGTDSNDGTDPDQTLDTDSDGLNWAQEYANLTDPAETDSDNDGVDDGTEVANATNPAVNDGPINASEAGPGVEFGTAYYAFTVNSLDPSTTGFRVYYGASSGIQANDYDAFLDITNTTDRSGYIDQEWGMNGVPEVYFRIAPTQSIGGQIWVGDLSNELSTYFAGLKDDQAVDPQNQAENVVAELDNLNDKSGDDDSVCFIGSVKKSFTCKAALSRIKKMLGIDKE